MKYLQLKFWAVFSILLCTACTGETALLTAPSNASQTQKATSAPQQTTTATQRTPDVPYVPTHEMVVDEMLRMAEVKGDDVLYDLGSGDGRIPITAAQRFGTRGIGIDINPQRIQEANANSQKAQVTDKVRFIEGDLFKENFSEATVVTLYLLPAVNLRLRPILLQQLKPGTRIVSHNYDMGDWKPEQSKTIKTPDGSTHRVFLWRVPQRK